MDDGLLHLGGMAVLIGIVYLNLEKLGSHGTPFIKDLQAICRDVASQMTLIDVSADALPYYARERVWQRLDGVLEVAATVCVYRCDTALKRPSLRPRLSSLAQTLRELRRAHFLRRVGELPQPVYPKMITLWFWVDGVCKAPALRFLSSDWHQWIIGILTAVSGMAFFCDIAGRIFDWQLDERFLADWIATFLYVLYVVTILAIVSCALAAHTLGGRKPRDLFPRCERYLADIRAIIARDVEQFRNDENLRRDEFLASGI